jgi:PKHD-type hydroxylase
MLTTIPDVITKEQAAQARARLAEADWIDGKVTAGYQAQTVKKNFQIPENHPVARELGDVILAALARSPLFMSAALPLRVFPPMFNSYSGGSISRTRTAHTASNSPPAPWSSIPPAACTPSAPSPAVRA